MAALAWGLRFAIMAAMQASSEDPHDKISDMFRLGLVVSVDGAAATVKCGDIVSPPLPWISLAGLFGFWAPLSVDQQVAILCRDGDIAGGLIIGGVPCNAFPPPGSGLKAVFKMPDGTTITYDAETHELNIALAGGSLKVTAPDGVTLIADMDATGNMTLTGDVSITGDLELTGDVSIHGDLHVSGDSTLGQGAALPVKLSDNSPATKVKAK